MVAKFKSHRVRSAATVALPTTTVARAAAVAAQGDLIFSAPNLDAGSGFFAAATRCCRAKWREVLTSRWRGG